MLKHKFHFKCRGVGWGGRLCVFSVVLWLCCVEEGNKHYWCVCVCMPAAAAWHPSVTRQLLLMVKSGQRTQSLSSFLAVISENLSTYRSVFLTACSRGSWRGGGGVLINHFNLFLFDLFMCNLGQNKAVTVPNQGPLKELIEWNMSNPAAAFILLIMTQPDWISFTETCQKNQLAGALKLVSKMDDTL